MLSSTSDRGSDIGKKIFGGSYFGSFSLQKNSKTLFSLIFSVASWALFNLA